MIKGFKKYYDEDIGINLEKSSVLLSGSTGLLMTLISNGLRLFQYSPDFIIFPAERNGEFISPHESKFLHSFSIKNILFDKMDLRLLFRVTIFLSCYFAMCREMLRKHCKAPFLLQKFLFRKIYIGYSTGINSTNFCVLWCLIFQHQVINFEMSLSV